MLGRKVSSSRTALQGADNRHATERLTLLTIVGAHAKIEGNSLVISRGGFFNGNVTKIDEQGGEKSPRPVYLVEGKRAGQHK